MGFRNPLSTASAVDTRTAAGGAGVRAYQQTAGTLSNGVLEYLSGVTGVDPATLALLFTGNATDGSSSFDLTGAGFAGVPGPKLSLRVAKDFTQPGTPYVSRVFLFASQAILNGQVQVEKAIAGPDTDWTALDLAAPTWVPYDTGANMPSRRKTAAGLVQLEGIVALASGSFASGFSSTIGSVPAAYVPTRASHRPCPIFNASGAWIGTGLLSLNTGGQITVLNGSGQTLTAGAGFGLGATFYRGS